MFKRNWKLFLEDILECIERVERYIEEKKFEIFRSDSKTIDAVIRNLEIIGEAARNIPEDVKEENSSIPWQDIIDFRNRITHGYFDISLEIVWYIIKKELPDLKQKVRKMLEGDDISK